MNFSPRIVDFSKRKKIFVVLAPCPDREVFPFKYFEELLLPREQLLNNIPKREELEDKEIPEEREIHEAIIKLYELGDKCMGIIKPIFNDLNDDSQIVGQFIEVLAKKTTEQAIYEKFKEIYEKKDMTDMFPKH